MCMYVSITHKIVKIIKPTQYEQLDGCLVLSGQMNVADDDVKCKIQFNTIID